MSRVMTYQASERFTRPSVRANDGLRGPNTRKWRVNLRKMVFTLLLTVLVVYTAGTLVGQQLRMRRLNTQLASIQAELDGLIARRASLEKKKEFLQTAGYIEKVAREKLGFTKKGEVLYVTDATSESR